MSAPGERGETARKYGRGAGEPNENTIEPGPDSVAQVRESLESNWAAMVRIRNRQDAEIADLQEHVDALIQANTGREALITDSRERADRQDAEIVKLSGKLAAVTGRVAALENPESALDRAASGLAAFADKIDAATPGKVPAFEVEKRDIADQKRHIAEQEAYGREIAEQEADVK